MASLARLHACPLSLGAVAKLLDLRCTLKNYLGVRVYFPSLVPKTNIDLWLVFLVRFRGGPN
jgi:hypothetical protein